MKAIDRVASQADGSARVLQFVSRAEQFRLRGSRNYGRYMRVVKNLVAPDGPERRQWQKESAEEELWDAAWSLRHGPVLGGASILQWRRDAEQAPERAS
jgi:hypothetical protein